MGSRGGDGSKGVAERARTGTRALGARDRGVRGGGVHNNAAWARNGKGGKEGKEHDDDVGVTSAW
jgi:hypothetical protein